MMESHRRLLAPPPQMVDDETSSSSSRAMQAQSRRAKATPSSTACVRSARVLVARIPTKAPRARGSL